MRDQSNQPGFNWLKATGVLTAVSAAMFGLCWWLVPLVSSSPEGGQAAVVTGALVAWLSSLLGVAPVALLARHGLMPTMYGFFGGAAIRVIVILVTVVAGVVAYALPAGPLVGTLMSMYLVLLFVEVAMVSRYVWHLRGPQPGNAAGPEANGGTNDDHTRLQMEATA